MFATPWNARAPLRPRVTAGSPIVILATGQSNFVQRPAFAWRPAPNVRSWNYNDTDGNIGTAYIAVPSATINQPEVFASNIAAANPGRQVYVIGVAIGSQPISQWMTGASAPDMWAQITNNITPALAAIGVTKVDILLWWEGENQTTEPWLYISNFNTVMARFQAQSWFPISTPVVVYGIAPTSVSGDASTDITNSKLQNAVCQFSDTRRFVYSGSLGPSIWADTLHLTGAGQFAVGALAANTYLHGDTHQPAIDPLGGNLRTSVLGRPANRNLILGGNFSANPWRFGTSFTAPATGTTFAEQWSWEQSGSGVVNVSQTADAPTIAQAGVYTAHCIDVNVTTADASIAGADYYGIMHTVDGRTASFLGFGQTGALNTTISFWVKSSIIGNYFVAIENSANNRSYTAQYQVDTANTWEQKWVTIPGDVTGTWVYGNGAGLRIRWPIASSDTYLFTPAVWNAGDVRVGNATRANGVSTNGNHFKLALVQVEEGIGPPSSFEQLPNVPVLASGAVLAGALKGVNLNSANTDNAIAINSPTPNYIVERITVVNASTSLTTATAGLFTSTGGGGVAVAANQALSAITGAAINTAANALNLTVNTLWLNSATLQFRVGTAQGATATGDVYVYIRPAP